MPIWGREMTQFEILEFEILVRPPSLIKLKYMGRSALGFLWKE